MLTFFSSIYPGTWYACLCIRSRHTAVILLWWLTCPPSGVCLVAPCPQCSGPSRRPPPDYAACSRPGLHSGEGPEQKKKGTKTTKKEATKVRKTWERKNTKWRWNEYYLQSRPRKNRKTPEKYENNLQEERNKIKQRNREGVTTRKARVTREIRTSSPSSLPSTTIKPLRRYEKRPNVGRVHHNKKSELG